MQIIERLQIHRADIIPFLIACACNTAEVEALEQHPSLRRIVQPDHAGLDQVICLNTGR